MLYPDDSTSLGQGLRFVQEYFLVACSLADLVRRFRRSNADWSALPEKVAIQLNDTHPAMAVPELMRILLDEAHLGWDEAWDLTQRTLAYTNHTLLPEALEKWPLAWFELMLPRHLEIILEINRRLLDDGPGRFPGDEGRVARMSLVEEGAERKIRMANLAIVGSHSTNGVAAIHSELLRTTTVKDLAEMFPERFNNKTNGVTPRRWLLLANPALARTITEAIGDGWITDLGQLRQLAPLADDAGFRDDVPQGQARGQVAVRRLAEGDGRAHGRSGRPSSIARSSASTNTSGSCSTRCGSSCSTTGCARTRRSTMPPRTFFFAGKAAPAYQLAKLIIKFINNLAGTIDGDPAVRGRLKVVVPARILRVAGGAADPRHRRLEPDLDRGLRGQRHQQHEVHDERRADDRHARRRHDRDGRGSGRGELLPVRPDGGAGRRTAAAGTARTGTTTTSRRRARHST